MYPLYNPLRTCPIEMGREKSIKQYPNRQFQLIDDQDRHSSCDWVPTRTQTQSDGPDPWLTLTRHGGWCNYWPSRCSRSAACDELSDMCNTRIVQRRYGSGVVTMQCRGYRTPSISGIPLACRYGNASLSRRKLIIPWMPTLLFIQAFRNTSNISHNWSSVRTRALGKHIPICTFDAKKWRILSSSCICNGRRSQLQFEQPWTDSTHHWGAV